MSVIGNWFAELFSNPGTFFTAFGAISTTTAAIVALYLGNRKPCAYVLVRLKIQRIQQMSGKEILNDSGYIFYLTYINQGSQPCFVEKIMLDNFFEISSGEVKKLEGGSRYVIKFNNFLEGMETSYKGQPTGHCLIGQIIMKLEKKYGILSSDLKILTKQVKKGLRITPITTLAKTKVKYEIDNNFYIQLKQFIEDKELYETFVTNQGVVVEKNKK